MKTFVFSMFVILSVISVFVSVVNCDQPKDCAILNNVVPECSCQGAPYIPAAIIIRCTYMNKMPEINGTYSGIIEEFSLKANANLRNLPENAFAGLKIKFINLLGTRLNNISDLAFNGTTDDLKKLSISGDDMTDVLPPMTAIKTLHSLTSLHIHRFKPSNGNLEGEHLFNYPNLQELTLENMKLVSLASNIFALPNLTTLNLAENLFTSIPSESIHTLHKLTSLTIKGSYIYDLPGFLFDPIPNPQIKILDFSHNNISIIEEDFFKGITTTLQTLILTQNPLSTASQLNRLSEATSLVELRLESLGLKSLSANPTFLTNKPKLKNLYLNGNQLKTLDVNVFRSVATTLLKLDLSNNQLNTLQNNIFNCLSSLKQLYIQSQKIGSTKLFLPSFTSLTSLQHLDLQLTNLDTDAAWQQIKYLKNLTSINLDQTGLTHITDFVFRDMGNLEEIHLHKNTISSITQQTFVGLRNSLETLYLNDNNISRIDHCTFDGLTKKLRLSLIKNPLHCDCELRWLKDKINNSEIVFIQIDSHEQCNSPASNKGKKFKDVDVKDFVCNTLREQQPCIDYYLSTTTTLTEPPSSSASPLPELTLHLKILETTPYTIRFEYSIQNLDYVTRIMVDYTNLKTKENFEERLADTGTTHTIKRLDADTSYEICLEVERTDNRIIKECKADKTPADPLATTVDPSMIKKTESNDIGIIIGSVIGGIILLCLLAAIIFILFKKRHTKSEDLKTQNGGIVTTRANLPRVGYDSKRYVKKKKTNGAASTSANNNNVLTTDENIQVSVISDGQRNQNNLGRVSAGSYQFLDENPSSVNTKPSPGEYMNSNESRPLPKTPNKNHGYYNQAFDRSPSTDKESSNNTYSEINNIV